MEKTNLYRLYRDNLTKEQCVYLQNFFAHASRLQKELPALQEKKFSTDLLASNEKYAEMIRQFYKNLDQDTFLKFFTFFQKQNKSQEYYSPYILIKDFSRNDYPAAAGLCEDMEESHIPFCELENESTPYKISIVGKKAPEGYFLWVQCDLPIRLLLIFFKGEEELLRTEICEYFDFEKPVQYEIMNKWDRIRILKILESK